MRTRLAILTSLFLMAPLLAALTVQSPAEARVKPWVTLSVDPAPIGQTAGGYANKTAYRGKVRPARKGAKVFLERRTKKGRWVVINRTTQNRYGNYVGFYSAWPKSREVLRVRSKPGRVKRLYSSKWKYRKTLPLKFGENFSGRRLNSSRWQHRLQDFSGRRMCAKPGRNRAKLLGDGKLTLSIFKLDNRNKARCPYGRWANGMIGTKARFQNGWFAARVKFQASPGMHGAFWIQGPPVTGAEIDVAEYFGAKPSMPTRYKQQRLGTLIHHTRADGSVATQRRIGKQLPTARILGKRKTPGNSYHVYAVNWTPTHYRFFLDGKWMFTTKKPHVSRAPSEIVLSLLTSDNELKRLKNRHAVVKVDWVRHWKAR